MNDRKGTSCADCGHTAIQHPRGMTGKLSSAGGSWHLTNYFVHVHGFAIGYAFIAVGTVLGARGLYSLPIQGQRQRKNYYANGWASQPCIVYKTLLH